MTTRKSNPSSTHDLVAEIDRIVAKSEAAAGARRQTYIGQAIRFGAKLSEIRDDLESRLDRGWMWCQANPSAESETDRWLALLDEYKHVCDVLNQAKAVLSCH